MEQDRNVRIPPQEETEGFWVTRGAFPPPLRVVQEALKKIEPDGSVSDYDEEGETFSWTPHKPVQLRELPPDVYNRYVLETARAIAGTCSHLAANPKHTDAVLISLAVYLTQYRGNEYFPLLAASFVRVDEEGRLHEPRLPDPYYETSSSL